MGDLGADGRRPAEPHSGVAARNQDAARRIDGELLAHAVLVPAYVGGDDGIPREHLPHLGQDAFRHHGEGVALFHGHVALFESLAIGGDLLDKLFSLDAVGVKILGRAGQNRKGLFQIRDHADFHRIVAADLTGFDVDLDQPGRRNAEGKFRIPGTAIRFLKP